MKKLLVIILIILVTPIYLVSVVNEIKSVNIPNTAFHRFDETNNTFSCLTYNYDNLKTKICILDDKLNTISNNDHYLEFDGKVNYTFSSEFTLVWKDSICYRINDIVRKPVKHRPENLKLVFCQYQSLWYNDSNNLIFTFSDSLTFEKLCELPAIPAKFLLSYQNCIPFIDKADNLHISDNRGKELFTTKVNSNLMKLIEAVILENDDNVLVHLHDLGYFNNVMIKNKTTGKLKTVEFEHFGAMLIPQSFYPRLYDNGGNITCLLYNEFSNSSFLIQFNTNGELQKEVELNGVVMLDASIKETDDKLIIYGFDSYKRGQRGQNFLYIYELDKKNFTVLSEYTKDFPQGLGLQYKNGFHFIDNTVLCSVQLSDGSLELVKLEISN